MKRIFLLILFLFITSKVHAASEFEANYDLQYAISPSGKTIVTQNISLTNLLTNFYPQKYALLIDSDKISLVSAYDEGGIITPEISVKEGKTEIALRFNTKIVGLGKSTKFTLRYEHTGIATKNGSIWEIYIPGVVNDPDIHRYNVSINVPESFGPVAYISPLPKTGSTWTKEQMIKGGIAAAYGTNQNFDVNLSYELQNTSTHRVYEDIALPPDTAFQKVTIESISPEPLNVHRDEDGNWLARYEIEPKRKLPIEATLRIETYLSPRPGFTTQIPNSAIYTKPLKYWNADQAIMDIAKKLQTPLDIYSYVVDTLSYDESKITKNISRLGATESLKQPTSAVCMEFTDLFISLARARGIPARRNVGFAYTDNEKLRPLSLVTDILHTWPEYYDAIKNIWIPVDPTWADTTGGLDYFYKLDFNHIVFAIHGVDSSRPYPAGFYHDPSVDKKDVAVRFAPSTQLPTGPKITTTLEFPKKLVSGFTGRGDVTIMNTSGSLATNIQFTLQSTIGNITLEKSIPELLPYEKIMFPVAIKTPFTFTNIAGVIIVQADGIITNYPFDVDPPYLLLTSGIVALIAISLLFYRLFTKRS